jgi:glutamyl-tRNA reductase
MSVLVVGLSYRSAPVPLLEQVAVAAAELTKVLHRLRQAPHVLESLVLSTCHRVEVYAEVEKFHGGVCAISELLAEASGVPLETLTSYLYVHYEDRAAQHLFSVACGLDSMVVGEGQILGQLRSAYRVAEDQGSTGRVLGPLVQRALRVGKRARSETGIDGAGASLVGAGLDLAAGVLGALPERPALVVGAGSMGALAGAALRRAGVGSITVANRTAAGAERLATALGGTAVGLDRLAESLSVADLVVCATSAPGTVLRSDVVASGVRRRGGRPLVVLDLALPRDVEASVRRLPGVTVVDLEALSTALDGSSTVGEVEAVRHIVAEEVGAFLAEERSARVAPTVVALRSKAAEVVDAELARLAGRLPGLDERSREEVATAVRRAVEKLLHGPTVRVKELAVEPGGDSYADALRELFGLDPATPEAVARATVRVEAKEPA